jgi:hypothetical protein
MDQEWAVAWDSRGRTDYVGFRPLSGLIAFRDCYDEHTASDVRLLTFIAGSARAVRDLLLWGREDARRFKRRLMGSIDCDNEKLERIVLKLGGVKTRFVFEDGAV